MKGLEMTAVNPPASVVVVRRWRPPTWVMLVWAAAIALVLAAGLAVVGLSSSGSVSLSARQVAAVACGEATWSVTPPADAAFFTSRELNCAGSGTSVLGFDGPGARDSFVDMVTGFRPVLVGETWAVTGKMAVLKHVQRELGGDIKGGF